MTGRTTTRLAVFILLALMLDRGLAVLLARLNEATFSGERGGLTNRALHRDADVLVLGSSRAQFHVMPSVLSQQLGGAIYNAGLKGHDLIYSVALADLWRMRHPAPRAYVLTIDMESLLTRANERAAAVLLAPYLDESARVREVIYDGDRFKPIMYWLSRSYRYNGRIFPIVKNFRFGGEGAPADGYLPAHGTFDPQTAQPPRHGMIDVPQGVTPSDDAAIAASQQAYSPLRVRLLKQLAASAAADKSQLFLVHPPIWGLPAEAHANWLRRLEQLVSELPGTQFIDLCEHAQPEAFAHHPELLSDFNHLNEAGARIFSTLLAQRLKSSLTEPSNISYDTRAPR